MKLLVMILAALSFGTARAAEAPAPFAPITIDQQSYDALMGYLGDQPAKFSTPIINLLLQRERDAQEAAKPKPPADGDKPKE